MTSSSSLGTSEITLQFDLSRDIDAAAQDVQAAINAAGGTLPKDLPNPPTYEKSNPADFTIMSLALTSDTLLLTDLDRYAEDFIAPQISQMTGVGLVDFHGQERPAVRVQLDPDKLAGLGLTLEDVRGIIGLQTVNAPKGSLNGPHRAVVLNATDQLMHASAYRSMVVAYRNGGPIRLSDLGTVVDAPEDVRAAAWLQDKRTVIVDIHKQPGYNVVDTIRRIKERLPALTASLPPAARLQVVGDRTQTIQASVKGVQVTLLITVALVVLVIFAFLRNLRATLIPALTIPLSGIATFGVMYLLGYSLDNVSLMALTIAVGFVVDDAIVVIENVTRHLNHGKAPFQAAIDGAREITFTVVSMTVSLIAVFIPILLMGGIIGRLFHEFAVCVSVAVAISGVVSLTVTPMLCAWMVTTEPPPEQHGRLYRASQHVFDAMLRVYAAQLDRILRRPIATLAVTLATLAGTLCLYVAVPKGLFPPQDTGLIIGVAKASPDISFNAMSTRMQQLARIIMHDPDVDNVYDWIGESATINQGRLMINLKPFAERHATAAQVARRLRRKVQGVEGVELYMQVRQDLQVGGRISATEYQYTLQDADIAELTRWSGIMQEKLAGLPQLRDVTSDAEALATSVTLQIDRDTASRLGVAAQAIDDVLYDAFGQRQVATLFTQSNQYHVIEEVDSRFQLTESLHHLYVRSTLSGQLVPLSMLAAVVTGLSPISINHQGMFPSVTLSFNLVPGYSLGDAVTAIRRAERTINKPDTVIATFQGTAQVFQSALKGQLWLILAAVIAVYIVLGILYESAIHPLTIISTLPSAGLGALIALIVSRQDLSVIGIIGIILLIGIVKKNAIVMIDFALTAERMQGLSPRDAIRQGCLLRFRPIMMTTMAAVLGALPLALGNGAGAELRRPLGIVIVGGLLVSQVLTLYTTPVVYLWFDRAARVMRTRHTTRRSQPAANRVTSARLP